jgi:hypothetical protein
VPFGEARATVATHVGARESVTLVEERGNATALPKPERARPARPPVAKSE